MADPVGKGTKMKEGWIDDSYLILFESEQEQVEITAGYHLQKYYPEHRIQAILGWDDFIVINESGENFRVPTVPLAQKNLEKYELPYQNAKLEADERFTGKIKWYVKPVVFGGDPTSKENTTWIDMKTHQELVIWWNEKYHEVSGE
jgi:hypothetical protein